MPAHGIRDIIFGDRLYQPIATLMMSMKAVAYSIAAVKGVDAPNHPDDQFNVLSDVSSTCLTLPAFGPLEGEILSLPPPPEFGISIKHWSPGRPAGPEFVELPALIPHLIPGIYVLHFDACHEWMRANGKTNTTLWPIGLDFGRVVRNAIAHGGRINFSSTSYRTVSWSGLNYSPTDNGRAILNLDLWFPDLLSLMISNDDELVQLGAPR